ncbi:MAG TPA: alpha/beta fold hydrolase [Candidatus Limnocylindrales bacterium]
MMKANECELPNACNCSDNRVGKEARVHFRADGSGEPVLLLHGIGRSLHDWTEQHELLRRDFRVYSVDLPGFGRSDRLSSPFSLAAVADALWGLLDAEGESKPLAIMGNSLGGAVALEMAAQRPDRTRALSLVNSAGFGRTVTVALRLLTLPGTRFLLRPNRTKTYRTERMIFHDRAYVTPQRIDHALALAKNPRTTEVFVEILRTLGTWRGIRAGWRADLLSRAAAHRIPTLVVWGGRDRVLPVAHLESVARSLPHATTHLFHDTGHMPQIERAAEFHRLATTFLERYAEP